VVALDPVAAFYEVRDMEYALDGAHDARSLRRLRRGDCLAKSELLAQLLLECGLHTRLVRWRYQLPAVVPEIDMLPARIDLHRAVQVRRASGGWIVVDPTHDAALSAGRLAVGEWDGLASTVPAYELDGPVLIEGEHDTEIAAVLHEIEDWTSRCDPAALTAWRHSYIHWLRSTRQADLPDEA
jgi:transglutaminase-like putative cysteine protease